MIGTRDTLRAIVHGIVPELAAHMNVTLVGAQSCILAEVIAGAVDDVTAARFVRRMSQSDTARIIGLAATQLRHLFFLQVGVQLGRTLGHTGDCDAMQSFGDTINAAFERSHPGHTKALFRFPNVDDVVRNIIRAGFDYCHVTQTDDGIEIREWRRVGYCAEHDLILCKAGNGIVVHEEFVEEGVAHRFGAPAIIERNETGAIIAQRYFHRGLEHVDGGMAVDA